MILFWFIGENCTDFFFLTLICGIEVLSVYSFFIPNFGLKLCRFGHKYFNKADNCQKKKIKVVKEDVYEGYKNRLFLF